MSVSDKVQENLAYGKELMESGMEGARQGRRAVLEGETTTDLVTQAAQESWQAGTIGVMAGAILGALADDRRPVRGVIVGVLLGAVLGYGGSFAWKTRPLTSAMARGAGRRIGEARDKHWLSKNPIPYA